MITVMGATGNTGRVVAERLLEAGRKVRVIGRSADRLRPLRDRGAEAAAGDALDASFLASAFQGAEAVYAMVPPDLTQEDPRGYCNHIGDAISKALGGSGVRKMVFLSSIGAEQPAGTGPIMGLHDLEERFRTLGVDLLILRPGYFYENFFGTLALVKHQGINGGAIDPEVPVAMTATRDIGTAAADELVRAGFRGASVRELLGPRDYSLSEATRILGEKIGKPELKYIRFTDADFTGALTRMGFSEGMARALLEMAGAISAGRVRPLEGRNPRTTMPTPFETVAEDLAAAYRQL